MAVNVIHELKWEVCSKVQFGLKSWQNKQEVRRLCCPSYVLIPSSRYDTGRSSMMRRLLPPAILCRTVIGGEAESCDVNSTNLQPVF